MEQKNQKPSRFVKIIHDSYEECKDGKNNVTWRKVVKASLVQFSPKTTSWNNFNSYSENMEAMILDIMENGYIFVSDKVAVPFFDIHQFVAHELPEQLEQPEQNKEKAKPIDSTKRYRPIVHKHRNMGRFEGIQNSTPKEDKKDATNVVVKENKEWNTDTKSIEDIRDPQ